MHDPDTSREGCKHILRGLGVSAVLIHADVPGALKCRLDEITDPAGVMGVTKTVRFRVEVHAVSEEQGLRDIRRPSGPCNWCKRRVPCQASGSCRAQQAEVWTGLGSAEDPVARSEPSAHR